MLLSQSGSEPESPTNCGSKISNTNPQSLLSETWTSATRMTVPVTFDAVLQLQEPTGDFLCEISDNIYNIDFVGFQIRNISPDGESQTLFRIERDENDEVPVRAEDIPRSIQYNFGPDFLELTTIGTELKFTVGDQPVQNFRMVERHYFKNRIIRSFDFCMPYCIPNTTNTWEIVYDMPELSEEEKEEIRSCPWETTSDSFYFANDKLVIHNKASYNYS